MNAQALQDLRKRRDNCNVWGTWELSAEELIAAYELGERNFSRANLTGANLESANLEGAYLVRANLIRANLIRANLTDAYLYDANLYDANLKGANLTGANLTDANLTGAHLIRANLTGAHLIRANLIRAYLVRANLTDAYLVRANLYDANLRGANLTGANLIRANLGGANLGGANLVAAVGVYCDYPVFISSRNDALYGAVVIISGAVELRFWAGCQASLTAAELRAAVSATHRSGIHYDQYLRAIANIEAAFAIDMQYGKWDHLLTWEADRAPAERERKS
jgi:uncharacterized protein YjbI with pentapeptide repeats